MALEPQGDAGTGATSPARAISRRSGGNGWRALVLALVAICVVAIGAGGAVAVSRGRAAVRTTLKPTATATATPPLAPSAPLTYMRAPCHLPPQKSVMMTPQQLAHPFMVGYEVHAFGSRVDCVVKGLYVPAPRSGVPHARGKVILVSLRQQWLWAYANGKLVFANPVTTGQGWLPTPQGTYTISQKVKDTEFYSPWPPGSRFYYSPEHVNYALYFRNKGYYIHDAPWRHAFGPGTNVAHTSPDGTREDGSHGCVNMTTAAAKWLFNWANIGTTVIVAN